MAPTPKYEQLLNRIQEDGLAEVVRVYFDDEFEMWVVSEDKEVEDGTFYGEIIGMFQDKLSAALAAKNYISNRDAE